MQPVQSKTSGKNLQGTTMKILRGARPIKCQSVLEHYANHKYKKISPEQYVQCYKNWLCNSTDKIITGLDSFEYIDFAQGTSHVFDHFVIKHANKEIGYFAGEFQYHQCISKHIKHRLLHTIDDLTAEHALLISLPFSDTGNQHQKFVQIMQTCNFLNIPVCLDLAYWGIAKDLSIDLSEYPCVKEITSSLSKPFCKLETHRVGIRFSKEYLDDGISMLNEVNMINDFSMSLGVWFMEKFDNSYNWRHYGDRYFTVCDKMNLGTTNTVIFGLGDKARHQDYYRGLDNNYRICISEYLT